MKNIFKYFIVITIFFVNLIGMAAVIFNSESLFAMELFVFLFFVFSAFLISYYLYKNRMAAWIMSLFFFAAYLINITLLYFYFQDQLLFVFLIFTSVIGFLFSIDNIKERRIKVYERKLIHEAEELSKAEEEIKEVNEDEIAEYKRELIHEAEELSKAEKNIKEKTIYEKDKPSQSGARTTKKPKKKIQRLYVASRKGENYHVLGCRWARKILPKRKLTFKTREEAEREGFKPCDCVK